jgi:hypothetical protein
MEKKQTRLMLVIVGIVFGFFLTLSGSMAGQGNDFLSRYENGDREFVRVEIDNKIVYYHQRIIDSAIVEKDIIVYQFDKATGEMLKKIEHWRDDLPEHVRVNIDRDQATAKVEGDILSANLFIISPDSDIFPIEPTPVNPCWIISSRDIFGNRVVSIIDAVTGQYLGRGLPPPSREGFTMTGPVYWTPCSSGWYNHVNNAITWFNTIGYSSTVIDWPTQPEVQGKVQDGWTHLFFEMAHGDSYEFCSGCAGGNTCEKTLATSVETWLSGYPKKAFTFLGSCGGMCDTGPNTFSHSFRKGSDHNTVTVGYCGMGSAHCDPACWSVTVDWQDDFFGYVNGGDTLQQAFNKAQADNPTCASYPACIRFAGDTHLKLKGYDFCFADSAGRYEFDFIDNFWVVGKSSSSCGLSDQLGWAFGPYYAFAVDVDSTVSFCNEGMFYFGHLAGLSYHWINTVGQTGTGQLQPCLENPLPAIDGYLNDPQVESFNQEWTYCFNDEYGHTYNFSLFPYPGGNYLRGEATLVGLGGPFPLIGAVEGDIFSYYVDVPSSGDDVEGVVFAGFVSTLSGVFRWTDGLQWFFSLSPCP